MRDFISRMRGLICVLGILLAAAPAALAQEPQSVNVSLQHGQLYPPGQWLPLRLDVRNTVESNFEGYVALIVRGDGLETEYHVPVNVPGKSRVLHQAYVVLPRDVPMTAEDRRRKLTPAVLSAELRSAGGARRDQEPLIARPLGEGNEGAGSLSPATTLVITGPARQSDHEAFEPSGFLEILKHARRYATTSHTEQPQDVPRHPAGLAASRVVAFSGCDPDALDPAQRHALLEHVRRGGVLVVAAPDPQVVRESWLAHYLPVELIGSRLMDRISGHDAPPLELIDWVPVTEALAGDGQILLRDDYYVHAAFRELGLGRIIYTSFPLSGLKADQPAAQTLWRLLLTPPYEPVPWSHTRLTESDSSSGEILRDNILSRMIGRKVPAWGLAAGIAGVYVLGVLGAQVVLGGAARPRAFVITMAMAGVLTAGLVVAAMIRQQDSQPMSARIATLDLSADGGGLQREAVVFVGDEDDNFTLEVADEDAALRPMQTFTPNDRPVIREQPFAAPRAGIRRESYQRVWTALGGVDASRRIEAVGRFDQNGLTVTIDNQLGGSLEAPQVIWGSTSMSLGDTIPAGEAQRRAQRGDRQSMLVSDEDALRQSVLASQRLGDADGLIRLSGDASPLVAGFTDEATAPGIIQPAGQQEVQPRSQVLVRAPLRIEPSQVGQAVRIPSPLMRLTPGPLMALPYDVANNEWIPTATTSSWLIGFTPPQGVGQLKPVRMSFDINLNIPSHRVTFRGQQLSNGQPRENRAGRVLAQWTQAVGPQDLRVDLTPADADEDGTVWVLLEVEPAGERAPGGLQPQWWFDWLRVSYEAQVVGPPPAPTLDRAMASARRAVENRQAPDDDRGGRRPGRR